MENINFLLKETDTNTSNKIISSDELLLDSLLPEQLNCNNLNVYSIVEELEQYYKTNYCIKQLGQILSYYGIQKNKMTKDVMIQVILFYEIDPVNKEHVEKRMRLWRNINELKQDLYFSKFILF